MGPYLDTSALANWYLNEPFWEAFEEFIQAHPNAAISLLVTLLSKPLQIDIPKAVVQLHYLESKLSAVTSTRDLYLPTAIHGGLRDDIDSGWGFFVRS